MEDRRSDPQWKLSPMEVESFKRWYEFLQGTRFGLQNTGHLTSTWHIVRSDDKAARAECHQPTA